MPANPVVLPDDAYSLAQVVNKHFTRERARMLPQATMFRVIWEYLAGARRFSIVDLTTGNVRASVLDEEGKLEYQGSDLLTAINRVAGYLASYDLTNLVTGDGMSLGSMKESAIGQLLSDASFSSQDVENAATTFAHIFTSLGSCGITCHVENNPANQIGLSADIEVVHPMEIVSFPSVGMDLSKQRGIGREYFVPLSTLQDQLGTRKVNAAKDKMYWWNVETGQDPAVAIGGDVLGASIWSSEGLMRGAGTVQPGSVDQQLTGWARVRDVGLDGPRGTCSRKVLVSGDAVLQDQDFSGVEAYTPLGFARFMENGTFYGAGMYHVLFSLSRGIERMMKALIQETTDKERFGYLVIPQGSFNVNQAMKEVGAGLKVLLWEPDSFTDNGHRPFIVQPNTTGDAPAKVAALSKQMFDQLNPLIDITREKGRVDSANGLEVLQEEADRSLTNATKGVSKAWGQMYKAGLAKCARALTESPRALPVGKLTLDLAGAVIDWENNAVSFPQNPLPTVSRLKCRPRLAGNRSKAQRKQEGLGLYTQQLASRTQVVIKSIEEGWDFAMWLEKESNGYAQGVRQILTLYGDGVKPGQMFENPNFVQVDIQGTLLDAFMGSTKMAVASAEVQSAFIQYKQFLQLAAGRILPESLPYNPEDIAAATQGLQGAQASLPAPAPSPLVPR